MQLVFDAADDVRRMGLRAHCERHAAIVLGRFGERIGTVHLSIDRCLPASGPLYQGDVSALLLLDDGLPRRVQARAKGNDPLLLAEALLASASRLVGAEIERAFTKAQCRGASSAACASSWRPS